MMARRLLTPPDMNPEGITAGEWVRRVQGKGVGRVESVTNDTALVDWLDGTNVKELIYCVYLRRVPSGEGIDRRRLA